jgi:acetyl-CoA acetyltransferase
MTALREVRVVGTGMVKFGRYPETGIADLAQPAIVRALRDAGIGREQIQVAYCGSVFGGMGVGQRILKGLGMTGMPVTNVENACSSGSTAFREAWLSVASGLYDVALVFGVEQLSRLGGGAIPLPDGDIEADQGLIMPALYAMRARRHMEEHGTTVEQLAMIAVKNHRNGVHNPYAQSQREHSLEEVLASRPVAEPLTLLHCCPTGDGAAAVIVADAGTARRLGERGVRVRASALLSGEFKNDFRDLTRSELSYRTAALAYETAALGPEDIDVAEVHDAFTIGELMYYEALGFCRPGEGGRVIERGESEIGGRIPVNPSGGLLSRGHPLGATGVAQIVEIVDQLEERCGPRQVGGARIGLTHCTGGGVAGFDHIACTVHILER